MKKRMIAGVLTLLLAVGALSGCSSSGDNGKTIVVGAKGFSENLIVAELYALALEDLGYTVERQYSLNTNVVHEAIVAGEVDVYPEYTGTSYLNFLGHTDAQFDADIVYNTVKEEYAEHFSLAALTPSQVNDSTCVVMLRETAEQYGITNLSDLQANASQLIWGTYTAQGDDERVENEVLAGIYGPFDYKEFKSIDSSLCWTALENKEVDACEGLTTQPQLEDEKYIVLEEDIPCRLPYYLFPVVRQEVLDADSEVEPALDAVSAVLDNETIIGLVAKTDLEGEEYEDVAAAFYEENLAK